MIYVLAILILASGYYTLTYGLNLLKEDNNILGGCAVIVLTAVSTLLPIIILFIDRS
jgi:hypothetical protein